MSCAKIIPNEGSWPEETDERDTATWKLYHKVRTKFRNFLRGDDVGADPEEMLRDY